MATATTERIVLSSVANKGSVHAEDVSQATAHRVSELLMKNHEEFHNYFFAGILHSKYF